MAPKRAVLRQRFDRKDVERRARQMVAIERGHQVGFDDMAAAPEIDDRGAVGELRERLLVQDAAGFRRQRGLE